MPKKGSYRIKVGYVSANIKSKTTVYMAQNLIGFHDKSKFEVHVFATSGPGTLYFLSPLYFNNMLTYSYSHLIYR
jgi:predicted O-linked N-acetylglucosamine transferase (SPINDLY family)